MRITRRFFYGLLVGGGLVACGIAGVALWRPLPDGPNVIVVTIDTTRADRVGCYGFDGVKTPAIDRLAAEGVLFEQAAATIPITLPSHCSLFTGLIPPHHGVRNNGNYFLRADVETLAEILEGKGYDTAAFVSAFVLNSKYGLDQGFQVYEDAVHDSSAVVTIEERNARETADLVIEWLRRERKRPYFLWVHFFDPHQAYMPPPPFDEEYRQDPYSGEIAFADSQLARILDEVNLEETLTVVTADHGESLEEHGERTHAYFIYDTTILVPLIVRYPDRRYAATRWRDQVSLVDIMPTVLAYLGLRIPPGLDGDSLLDLPLLEGERRYAYCESTYPLSFGWHPLAGLRDGEWKWIQAPKPELYHIASDPGETANVAGSHPDVAARMDAFLADVDPFAGLASSENQTEMTAEDREKLLALGYIGGGLEAHVARLEGLPDPKDKLPMYLRILAAKGAFAGDHLEQAERGFRAVLAEDPDILNARFFLGRTLLTLGKLEEATLLLEETRQRLPDDITVYCVLAVLYNRAGLWDKALAACEQGLGISDREASLMDQMGVAFQGLERWDEALDYGRRAVRLNPDQPEYWNNLGATYYAVGEYRRALKPLRTAVSLRGEFSEAQFNLGASLAKLARYREARTAYEAALHADPGNLEALVQLTKVLLYLNQPDAALSRCRTLRELRPDDPGTLYFMSVAYRQKGEADNAIRSLSAYLDLVPEFVSGYEEISILLLENKRTEEARRYALIAQSKGSQLPRELSDLVRSGEGM